MTHSCLFKSGLYSVCRSQSWLKAPRSPNVENLCSHLWLLLLITEVQQRGRNIVVAPPPIVSLPLRLKWLSGHLKGWHTFLLPVSVISLSPFGSQTLKTRIFKNNCIWESDCTCSWLRRAEKLSLHLRLMLGTETIYNWKKKKTTQKQKPYRHGKSNS